MMFDDIEDLSPNVRIECLRLAAEHGNVTALHELGMAYLRGSGVDVDEVEAAKCLHKAAEQGGAESQYTLGRLYATGHAVGKNEEKSFYYARRIVETYSKVVEELRTGVDGHSQRLEDLIEKAESGDAESQYLLGRMFANGDGVEKDMTLSAWWYQKSADTYKQTADQYKQSVDAFFDCH